MSFAHPLVRTDFISSFLYIQKRVYFLYSEEGPLLSEFQHFKNQMLGQLLHFQKEKHGVWASVYALV